MRLVLLTTNYPFPPGEEFLETEAPLLAESFESVTVVPLSAHGAPRAMPGGMTAVPMPPPTKTDIDDATKLCTGEAQMIFNDFLQAGAPEERARRETRTFFMLTAMTNRLCRETDIRSYDVIYSYWGNGMGVVMSAIKRHMSGRPCAMVSRLHGGDLYAKERSGLDFLPFQRLLLDSCDSLRPCSVHGAEYLGAAYPQHASKISCSHLGVPPREHLNHGSYDGVLRVVSCSRLLPVKRVEILAEALGLVKRRVEWTHIGGGPDEAGVLAIARALPTNITCRMAGDMPNSAVIGHYQDNPVDVLVNVSSSEGVPVSIMEAASFGVPALATDVGGVSDLFGGPQGKLLRADITPGELAGELESFQFPEGRRREVREWQRKFFSTDNQRGFIADAIRIFEDKKRAMEDGNENTR